MREVQAGFTLIELLVSILVTSIMMSAVVGAFTVQSKATIEQDRVTALEENLRASMHIITDTLRSAGYGTPRASLNRWIAAGWGNLPVRLPSTTNPVLSVASCTAQPVARLTADAADGAPTLTVDSTANITLGHTIWINRSEFLRVVAINSSTVITIDTNPSLSGNQPLERAYYIGTPICRLDVTVFRWVAATNSLQLQSDATSTLPGVGVAIGNIGEGITDMQVTSLISGRQYRVTLTGRTKHPQTSQDITRSLSSDVSLGNR